MNEWASASNVGIEVNESTIPVSSEVSGLCELYGFEPFDLANEGTFIIAVPQAVVAATLEIMQTFCHCQQAALIGHVNLIKPGKVILNTPWASRRFLDVPQGELLPRIC